MVAKIGGGDKMPRITETQVGDYLEKMYVLKLAGLDGMHPSKLKELAEIIVEPLLFFKICRG